MLQEITNQYEITNTCRVLTGIPNTQSLIYYHNDQSSCKLNVQCTHEDATCINQQLHKHKFNNIAIHVHVLTTIEVYMHSILCSL